MRRAGVALVCWLVLCVGLVPPGPGSTAGDPPYYLRKATWQETLRASREALRAEREAEAGRNASARPFISEVLRGSDPAQHVRVPVTGWRELYLIVGDDGDYHNDCANWGEAKLVAPDGTEAFLDAVEPASATQEWGSLQRNNKSVVGGAIQVGQQVFPRGLGTHAKSVILYRLDKDYAFFDTWIGVDVSRGSAGSVQFVVSPNDAPAQGAGSLAELWRLVARDFPEALRETRWEQQGRLWEKEWAGISELAGRYVQATRGALAGRAVDLAKTADGPEGLAAVRALYHRSRAIEEATAELKATSFRALRLAITDLTRSFGSRYPKGHTYLARLAAMEKECAGLLAGAAKATDDTPLSRALGELEALRREALLSNPLIDFDRILVVKRGTGNLGLPANWQSNSSLPKTGYDNELAVLSPFSPDGKLATLYRPEDGKFVGDVDLHFNGGRFLFSSIGSHGRWQVFEMKADGTGLRQVSPGDQPDVDNYDACYLPSGKVVFNSTACFVGVPCVYGSDHVTNLYVMDADGRNTRQLTVEQDHDWCPTMLNNGRVMYLRWEYADIPHSQSRLLFHMNPDGTEQAELYGTNSYWPNGVFYARAVPGHPSKVVGVISGHHGVPRMGELVVFDPARGHNEESGAVQRIPGHGKKVERVVADALVDASWPKFLHPYPLSEKYFLVACKPTPESEWGLYLADAFDNLLLIKEEPGCALLEPTPLRATPRPPVVPERVDWKRQDATVTIGDIYRGDGLKGIPRGTVKKLRVFSYHYAYQGMGGLLGVIGMDGPWDIKRILGTVPVEADGSARFRVPAMTPISIQPLDSEGKALQLMRSWMTAMPGENLSCVGCHERGDTPPPNGLTVAQRRPPAEITPWYGPTRGFSYPREVQPVIDHYCVGCHGASDSPPSPPNSGGAVAASAPNSGGAVAASAPNSGGAVAASAPNSGGTGPGSAGILPAGTSPSPSGAAAAPGDVLPDLRGSVKIADWRMETPGNGGGNGGRFSVGYVNLARYVRRPGIESDYHLLTPKEFHADTTELVQMLRKGHHGVRLDPESWDRLITWIDLNAPYHGTWHEELANPGPQRKRRRALRLLYAGIDEDPEEVRISNCGFGISGPRPTAAQSPEASAPPAAPGRADTAGAPAGPASGNPKSIIRNPQSETRLGAGQELRLVRVPAGEFVMGDPEGQEDERPAARVRINRPFWMGACEVTNAQYACFDPRHDSRVEDKLAYQFGVHGYPMNGPDQPVVRVSWERAVAFCRWLSQRTGKRFSLPTEAQWEYACRAGSATAFSYGGLETDFAKHANLADAKLTEFASNPYTVFEPLVNPSQYDDYIPKDARFNDGGLITMPVGKYQPNAWGLHDMHGNAAEWTRSTYAPYPYRADAREAAKLGGRKVVRGGSWRDRPARCRSAFRLSYPAYQRVFNVGFRVVCEDPLPSKPPVTSAKVGR